MNGAWAARYVWGHSSCRLPVQRWLSLILAKFSLHMWLRCLLVDLSYFCVNHIFFAGWNVLNITSDSPQSSTFLRPDHRNMHFMDFIIGQWSSGRGALGFIVVSVFISDFLKENGNKIHISSAPLLKNTTCMLLFDVLLNLHDREADTFLFFFALCEATFWLFRSFICSLFTQGLRAQLRRPVSPGCFLLYQQVNICFVLFTFVRPVKGLLNKLVELIHYVSWSWKQKTIFTYLLLFFLFKSFFQQSLDRNIFYIIEHYIQYIYIYSLIYSMLRDYR